MKRKRACTRATGRALAVFACLVGLAPIACDNDINFNPTSPTFPFTSSTTTSRIGEIRNLDISGTLTAEQGACLEATVLLDGEELSGARTTCPEASGCATGSRIAPPASYARYRPLSIRSHRRGHL